MPILVTQAVVFTAVVAEAKSSKPTLNSITSAMCASLLERWQTKPEQFQLSYIGWMYRNEEKGTSYRFGSDKFVKYYDSTERLQFEISFQDGAAVRKDGARLWGCYDYVADRVGKIFILSKDQHHHHSSAIAGEPASSAGTMCFDKNQKIEGFNRESGHYQTTRKQLRRFAEWLKELGADLSKTHIIDYRLSGDAG